MRTALRLSAGLLCTAILALCASTSNLQPGKAELKSAGSLAFGQDGILFVGDTAGRVHLGARRARQQGIESVEQHRNQGHQREDRRHAGNHARSDSDQRYGGKPGIEERLHVGFARPRAGCNSGDSTRRRGGKDLRDSRSRTSLIRR